MLDLIVPSVMVDAYGDLYFTTMDMGWWFGGRAYYVGKVTINNVRTCSSVETEHVNGHDNVWNGLRTDAIFTHCVWHGLAPCVAQETAYSDKVYVVFNAIPSRYWKKKNSDTEGLVLVTFPKSKLNWDAYTYADSTHANLVASKFGFVSTKVCNRPVYTVIHDTNLKKTVIYWLNNFYNGSEEYHDTNKVYLNYHIYDDNMNQLKNYSCINNEQYNFDIASFEPRITKIGNDYHFMVSNGIYPQWYKASASTGDTIWHGFNPHTYTLSTDDCCYHTDMQVMQHNGKNLALVMSLVKISHMSGAGISADSKKRWTDDKFVPWNKSYIALVISSWYEGSGYSNIDIPPDNIIEVFPVTTASNAETMSTSTLYKNTHKFVTYTKGADNYIIYAYCYPGKSKQLYLGTCRYQFDSNGHIHLCTKREFRNKKGESFGNLTNCSRIIHMDVKNGHLWVVFMSTDSKTIYYFHTKVDDVVKLAP